MEGSRGRHALDISIVFTTLATVTVLCRFYTRLFLVRQMGSDDWIILISLVSHTALWKPALLEVYFNSIPDIFFGFLGTLRRRLVSYIIVYRDSIGR